MFAKNNKFMCRGPKAVIQRVTFVSIFVIVFMISAGNVMPNSNSSRPRESREFWMEKLGLEPHPEGGYFRYVFGSDIYRKTASGAERKNYSGIYFMVTHDSPSHFHQMISDEIWYYHSGDPLTMHVIDETGAYRTVRLGPHVEHGEVLSVVMRGGWIFGASVDSGDYTLVSCAVVPGFDDADYRILTQSQLLGKYPQYRDIILKMAYQNLPK
jgi:hypothetical protein